MSPTVMTWQPIETAPKDGRAVLLLSAEDRSVGIGPRVAIGFWNPDGDSWVDRYGQMGGDCYTLAVTGNWLSEGGWFQPDEVTHWMPLPPLPSETEP